MKSKFIVCFLMALSLLCATKTLSAQTLAYDTMRVMTYNADNYGFPAIQDCPGLLTDSKHGWLRTIVDYAQPDILGLEKMDASPSTFTSDTIIQKVLDSVCNGCYSHTPFTNISGYSKEDMLYFNTGKLGLASNSTIYSSDPNISDINLHRLFYKSPSLGITHDTIFINVMVVHLESGSGSANERASEIKGAMQWLNSNITAPGNYMIMGDFNTQSATESCYTQLVNSSNTNTRFIDPLASLGDWGNSAADYAMYMTQSTRINDPGDCSATGGLGNRFDMQLFTQNIIDGKDSVKYIPNSYQVIGQDGKHLNMALNDAPQNTSVSSKVLNALYYMSEHLPVVTQLAIGGSATVAGINMPVETAWNYSHTVNDQLIIKPSNQNESTFTNCSAQIFDMQGRLLMQQSLQGNSATAIPTTGLSDGMYLLVITQNGFAPFSARFAKVGY